MKTWYPKVLKNWGFVPNVKLMDLGVPKFKNISVVDKMKKIRMISSIDENVQVNITTAKVPGDFWKKKRL